MQIPHIDFSQPDEPRGITEVDRALCEYGFFQATGLGIDIELQQQVFSLSRQFFSLPAAQKQRFAYRSAQVNFGYQGLQQENLDPLAPADLKETFTMRNILRRPMAPARWPDPQFETLCHALYTDLLRAARRLQVVLARALGLPHEFFVRVHNGENVTLRLLHYPCMAANQISRDQLGAGAHTDYGMLTLLLQDDVGGLQVRDPHGRWLAVPPQPGCAVVNCGDLLEVWTNGRYPSTQHRVQPNQSDRPRTSIAMFVDPDSATRVDVLPSCVDAAHPPRFDATTAGEHLQRKLEASHKQRFSAR